MATYRMTRHGTTSGASGYFYRWRRGDRVTEYSEGDLDHVTHKEPVKAEGSAEERSAPDYETRPMKPTYTKEHVGAGWYEIRQGSEVVKKVRGKDTAEQELNNLKTEE